MIIFIKIVTNSIGEKAKNSRLNNTNQITDIKKILKEMILI